MLRRRLARVRRDGRLLLLRAPPRRPRRGSPRWCGRCAGSSTPRPAGPATSPVSGCLGQDALERGARPALRRTERRPGPSRAARRAPGRAGRRRRTARARRSRPRSASAAAGPCRTAAGPRPRCRASRRATTGRTAGPGASPRARSGAMYDGEPSSRPVEVMLESPVKVAMPKSVRTTRPSSRSSTLPGFTSRWTMPCACAVSRAPSTASPTSRGAARRQRAVGADDLGEGARLDELHDEVRRAVLLGDVVDRDGAGVVEPGGGARLAAGALAQDLALLVGDARAGR